MAIEKMLLTRQEVEEMLSISRSWLYAEMSKGRFPRSIALGRDKSGGRQTVRWRRAEIEAYAESAK